MLQYSAYTQTCVREQYPLLLVYLGKKSAPAASGRLLRALNGLDSF